VLLEVESNAGNVYFVMVHNRALFIIYIYIYFNIPEVNHKVNPLTVYAIILVVDKCI